MNIISSSSGGAKKCVLFGSVPMSLYELTLAPAIIASEISKKGHFFEYVDTNLELFKVCNKNLDLYHEKIEILTDYSYKQPDFIIEEWLEHLKTKIDNCDFFLQNVFSHYSHVSCLKLVELVRNNNPNAVIIIGGIGADKRFNNSDDTQTLLWVEQKFPSHCDKRFGKLLLDNNLVDYWQEDASTSLLNTVIPCVTDVQAHDGFDYSVYKLEEYPWEADKSLPVLGSYGCVRQCSFCDVIKYFPAFRFIEADQLTKQLVTAYENTKINKFIFMDSLINGSLTNFENLCKNIINSKQKGWLPSDLKWSGTYICRSRSTQLDRIHSLLKEAGAENLVIGVESGSDRVRFEMEKKFTNEDLLYELQAFDHYGVKARLLFFPAWLTETQFDFEQTLDLLQDLGQFAQTGTLDGLTLSNHGFSLIDGTPIDDKKDEIGLRPGPISWLWHCEINPTLNYWESLRRRFMIIAVGEYFGINFPDELRMKRIFISSLKVQKQAILDYVGPLNQDLLDCDEYINNLPDKHDIKFCVINSDFNCVQLNIQIGEDKLVYNCKPGFTDVNFTIHKKFKDSLEIKFNFIFDNSAFPVFSKYENGDYFSKTGIYLDKIYIDKKDITLWGFNQISQVYIHNKDTIDQNYATSTLNCRCVCVNSTIVWSLPQRSSIFQHLWNQTEPDLSKEKFFIQNNLKKLLKIFMV